MIQNESALQSLVEVKKLLEYVEGPDLPGRLRRRRRRGDLPPRRVPSSRRSSSPVGTDDGVERRRARRHGRRARRPRHARHPRDRAGHAPDGRVERRLGPRPPDRRGGPRRARPRPADSLVIDARPQGGQRRDRRRDRHRPAGTSGDLSSLYPQEHPRRPRDERRADSDTDLYQQVQVASDVDFASLDAVAVLVPLTGRGRR